MGYYTAEQIGAMKRGIILGRILQREHPEIVDMYRRGNSYSSIVKKLDIELEYGVSWLIAKHALHRSISGYRGSLTGVMYEGLIDEEERRKIEIEHNKKSGRSLSKSNGLYPWFEEELEYLQELLLKEEYKHPAGSKQPGRHNFKHITLEINRVVHQGKEVRTKKAVRRKFEKLKNR